MTEKCAICLEELYSELGSAVPCGHVFHRSCFQCFKADATVDGDTIEHTRPRCPCCKKKVKRFHNIFLTIASPEAAASLEAKKTDRALASLTSENMSLHQRVRDLKTLSKNQDELLAHVLPRFDQSEQRYSKLKFEQKQLQKKLGCMDEETVEIVSQWNHVEMQLANAKAEQKELEMKLREVDAENRD